MVSSGALIAEDPSLLDAIIEWAQRHPAWLFAALAVVALAAIVGAWRRRPPPADDLPVPLLSRRGALALLVIATTMFVALLLMVMSEGRLVAFDQRLTARVAASLGPDLLQWIAAFSRIGGTHVLLIAGLLVTFALLVFRHWILAAAWAVTLLGNGFLISIFKQQLQRPRPLHDHGFAMETSWSFPSGHAAGSIVFYGMLGYLLLVLLPPRWHRSVVIGAGVVIGAIGASRILLQVHFLSDVLAGFALGLAWLALGVGITEFLRVAHGHGQRRAASSQTSPDPS
jgi:membrane-associated phospholipid phosphatase